MAKAQRLEALAYATAEGSRAVGSHGLDTSLQYVLDTLHALDYYHVTTQSFSIPMASSSLSVNGTAYESSAFTYSPAGYIVAPLASVANLGCNAVRLSAWVPSTALVSLVLGQYADLRSEQTDFPADIVGKVALIPRGACTFVLKVARAGAAGASGVVMYNNADEVLNAGLSEDPAPEGPFVPTAGISKADGLALAAMLGSGGTVTASLTLALEDVPT